MPPENRDADHGSQKVAADVVVVGAGLSGLVAAATAYAAGKTVAVLDQEPGGIRGRSGALVLWRPLMVNTPEQQRLGVRDSTELALSDWLASAAFDRSVDQKAREWAEAYVHFASGEKRSWLRSLGVGFFPLVQWLNAAATGRRATAIPCPGSTSRGGHGTGAG